MRVLRNTTATLTIDWLRITKLITVTGICLRFSYMSSADNNTLSVFVEDTSGKKTLLWAVRGNHGNSWSQAAITLRRESDIKVTIKQRCCNLSLSD